MSNLSKHLSAQHGNTKLVAKDPARRSSEGVDEQPAPPKQTKLFSSVGAQKQVTQKDINKLVLFSGKDFYSHVSQSLVLKPLCCLSSP